MFPTKKKVVTKIIFFDRQKTVDIQKVYIYKKD